MWDEIRFIAAAPMSPRLGPKASSCLSQPLGRGLPPAARAYRSGRARHQHCGNLASRCFRHAAAAPVLAPAESARRQMSDVGAQRLCRLPACASCR